MKNRIPVNEMNHYIIIRTPTKYKLKQIKKIIWIRGKVPVGFGEEPMGLLVVTMDLGTSHDPIM